MSERETEIPCLLDPALTCSVDCGLHGSSKEIITEMARVAGFSIKEEVRLIRRTGLENRISLRTSNAEGLASQEVINACEHYPNADIRSQN